MAADLEILFRTPKHVFARWQEDIVIQIRAEELTVETLNLIETSARLARARIHTTSKLGALMIIEERAPAPMGPAAVRQREMLRQFNVDERLYLSLVLEGSGLGVSLKRTLARTAFSSPRRHICGTAREGARWLATSIGQPERFAGLVEIVEELRPS
jgi:hypothetical protein